MATVRFSKKLICHIAARAEALMEPAVDKARKAKPDNSWGQRIYDILLLEAKPFIAQAPAGWLKHVDQIGISAVGGRHCDMTFTFGTPQPWPYQRVESELALQLASHSVNLMLKDHLIWGEFHAEVTTYHQHVQDAATRRSEFVRGVMEICTTCGTLAPALKAWPPLWGLVPEDVKVKYPTLQEHKKVRKEVVLTVDVGRLTALSTAAKLGL